jgi:hypothetical protein
MMMSNDEVRGYGRKLNLIMIKREGEIGRVRERERGREREREGERGREMVIVSDNMGK